MKADPPETVISESTPNLRSGSAARLAGLPVTTLRVWERRYGVVNAGKSETGRRMYSHHDVMRLKLLRELTNAGHAIGTIASLELRALQFLATDASTGPIAAARTVNVVVVGRTAATAVAGIPHYVLTAVYDDLAKAEQVAPPDAEIDLLLVRLSSLQPSCVDRVLALGTAASANQIMVVYEFAAEPTVGALRDVGVIVHRDPNAAFELAQLVRTSQASQAFANAPERVWLGAPRLFSDEALSRLTEASASMDCECVRHMAEITQRLVSFERYSRDCTSTSPADADLHRRLSLTSAAARSKFEMVLKSVVDQRRVDLANVI